MHNTSEQEWYKDKCKMTATEHSTKRNVKWQLRRTVQR
jgi:hypothetical protein